MKTIKKILIANRGEIACRIIRTAKAMDIKTVAVYSDADSGAMHVQAADNAIYIGPAPAQLSYLNSRKILEAIKISGADAIHPGYGFLSENFAFSDLMQRNHITFIGPSPDAIKKMGNKIIAKKIAAEAGVSIVPGCQTSIKTLEDAKKIGKRIGYPVMLKAAAGGGGKGMRVVRSPDEMEIAFGSTKNEARNNFADERVFIEKYIENPRHIEIQVMGDIYGNYICLGERECSIQRRHQKVIEEAPSVFVDEKMRKQMYAQSIALAKTVGYYSAGTVEFIVDSKKRFYFMEMNTRLQVEHPVTELVTGVDIVELMIRIARGEKLPLKQSQVIVSGWAIESRIYAEDPASGFIPSTGKILTYIKPEKRDWLRIDEGVQEGIEVSPYYDAMISKVCVKAENREMAIERMRIALNEYIIGGIAHNITAFLQKIFLNSKFITGDISTNFIDDELFVEEHNTSIEEEKNAVLLCASAFVLLTYYKRNMTISGQKRNYIGWIGTRWVISMNESLYPVTVRQMDDGYEINIENRKFEIISKWTPGNYLFQCIINEKDYVLQVRRENSGSNIVITFMDITTAAKLYTPYAAGLLKYLNIKKKIINNNDIIANISGTITDIRVSIGDSVWRGQHLISLEAMKMENALLSPIDGIVEDISVNISDSVNRGELLIRLKGKDIDTENILDKIPNEETYNLNEKNA